MNRIFKSVWSSARGCCVAAGENAKSRGKGSRSKLTIAAAAAAMIAGGMALNASANAYVESASLATSKDDFSTAAKSWETEEYKKDWGAWRDELIIGLRPGIQRSGRGGRRDGFGRAA